MRHFFLLLIWQASEKYCIRMPNKWNFSFDYFYAAIVALGIYVPGIFACATSGDIFEIC